MELSEKRLIISMFLDTLLTKQCAFCYPDVRLLLSRCAADKKNPKRPTVSYMHIARRAPYIHTSLRGVVSLDPIPIVLSY